MSFTTAVASKTALCVASGMLAYNFFNILRSTTERPLVVVALSPYPDRLTAYKIGILCTRVSCFWNGLNQLAVSGATIYSMMTGYPVFMTGLFLKTVMVSSALSFGLLALSFVPSIYVLLQRPS